MKVVIEADAQYKNTLLEIARAIHANIAFEETDPLNNLPEHVRKGIFQSREQIAQGKYSAHEDIMKKYRTRSEI